MSIYATSLSFAVMTNLMVTPSEFSISMWVKLDQDLNKRYCVFFEKSNSSEFEYQMIYDSFQDELLFTHVSANYKISFACNNMLVPDGKWHNIIFILSDNHFNRAILCKTYINTILLEVVDNRTLYSGGNSSKYQIHEGFPLILFNHNMCANIETKYYLNMKLFPWKIASLALFNKALTKNQIDFIYHTNDILSDCTMQYFKFSEKTMLNSTGTDQTKCSTVDYCIDSDEPPIDPPDEKTGGIFNFIESFFKIIFSKKKTVKSRTL